MLVSVTLVFPFATWLCFVVPPPRASFLPSDLRFRSIPLSLSSCVSPFGRRLVLLRLLGVAVGPRRPTPRLVSTRDTLSLPLSGPFGAGGETRGRETQPREGEGSQPHPLCQRGRVVSRGRRGDPRGQVPPERIPADVEDSVDRPLRLRSLPSSNGREGEGKSRSSAVRSRNVGRNNDTRRDGSEERGRGRRGRAPEPTGSKRPVPVHVSTPRRVSSSRRTRCGGGTKRDTSLLPQQMPRPKISGMVKANIPSVGTCRTTRRTSIGNTRNDGEG